MTLSYNAYMKDKRINLRIEDKIYAWLRRRGIERGESISKVIRDIIKHVFEAEK